MARKKIDEAIRQKVTKAHARGLPMRKIASEYGVSLSSVSRIVKEAGAPGSVKEAQLDKEREERKKRIVQIEKRIAELEQKIRELESKKK
jgi:transposase